MIKKVFASISIIACGCFATSAIAEHRRFGGAMSLHPAAEMKILKID